MEADFTNRAVFFDIGGTLASPVLSPAGELIGLNIDPAVIQILGRLREQSVRLGIISNTGEETEASMRVVLEGSGLYEYFEPKLLVYSSTLPKTDPRTRSPVKPKPHPSVYRYAANRAGLKPSACVFVGEDREERAGALAAGLRVAPHPRLAEDALNGIPLRYVRITPGPGAESAAWHDDLLDRAVVPLAAFGQRGEEVIAIVGAGTAAGLDDAGYLVTRLGPPDAPLTADMYLLRDDVQTASGFGVEEGHSSRFFGAVPAEPALDLTDGGAGEGFAAPPAGSPSDWVLASTGHGLLVALPAGRSVEEFHFRDARHGHNVKLVPSLRRVKPFAAGGGGEGFAAAEWLPAAPPGRGLSDAEREAVGQIDAALIASYLDRFAGLTPLNDGEEPVRSRHVRHPDNARAVAAAAAEFESLGLTVRLRRFVHEGRPLENVEAELPGESPEAVLVTAHIDSTAASAGPVYRPARDPAPGADDDASGVAAVLAVARALAGRQYRRTLRFVLFNAEEQGLVGSQVYAAAAADRGDPIVAVLQMDMVGFIGANARPPRPFEIHIGHERPEVVEASRRLAELIGRVRPEVAPGLLAPQVYTGAESPQGDPAAGRSDHASFQDHGYPACVLSEDFFAGPGHDAPAPQPNPNYHKPTDQSVEYEYAAQIARCIAAAALVLLATEPEPAGAEGRSRRYRGNGSSQPSLGAATMAGGIDIRERALAGRRGASWKSRIARYSSALEGTDALRGESGQSFRAEGENKLTGTARRIVGPQPVGMGFEGTEAGDRISQALALAAEVLSPPGFDGGGGEKPEFVPDPIVQRTSGGVDAVHLNQHYRGIPIFEMNRTVRFYAGKGSTELVGDHYDRMPPSFEVRPVIDATRALTPALEVISSGQADRVHASHWSPGNGDEAAPEPPDLSGYTPAVALSFAGLPGRPTVFERGNLGAAIPANLTIFLADEDQPRLGWYFQVTTQGALRQYEVVISADREEPEVFYAQEVTQSAATPPGAGKPKTQGARTTSRQTTRAAPGGRTAAAAEPSVRGSVYNFNPGDPPKLPEEVDFPLPASAYPVENPDLSGFPNRWVSPNQTQAVGPNVTALLGEAEPSDPGSTLTGKMIDGRLVFKTQGNATQLLTNNDQKLLSIFYFCNYMHNFFYLLGFDEAAGNFQGNDPVIARAHPGPVWGTANMLTLPEHQSPLMNMGEVSGTGGRHTAMDADVVFHEYVHGVTNRLVGGPMNVAALRAQQSGSMGEGWGDYIALTIQNYDLPPEDERVTTGDWVTKRPGQGIRMHPYDDAYPANYGDMRTNTRYQEVHNAGEIWCAALMHMNRKLGEALGDRQRGVREAWQLMVDSLKLCPVNPSFLDARDAMFAALEARGDAGRLEPGEYEACRKTMWEAFAGFGMGAKAPNVGNRFLDAQSDFTLPEDLGSGTVDRRAGELVNAASGGFMNPDEPVPEPEGAGTEGYDDTDFQRVLEYWGRLSERERGRLLGQLEAMAGAGGGGGTHSKLTGRPVAAAKPPRVPPGATLNA